MDKLQIFDFNNQEVRTTIINNKPYFCLKDVCKVLELTNPTVVSSRLKEEGLTKLNLGGRSGETIFINESNLYKTIFQSRKAEAEVFQDWVTDEVLPTIRKTGGYHLPGTYKEALQEIIVQIEEKEKLQIENQTMKPKAEYFDALVDRKLLTNFRDTAKELHKKQTEFVSFLLDKYIYRDARGKLKPYAQYVEQGLFEIKEFVRNEHPDVQTLITPKGRETFRLLIA